MSIVASYRQSVKSIVHPHARRRPVAHRFGEGLVTTPTPQSPSRPTREDELWFSAYCLSRDGIDCDPPIGLSYDEVTAWLNGFGWGLTQRDADLDETFVRELEQAECTARDLESEMNEWEGGLR